MSELPLLLDEPDIQWRLASRRAASAAPSGTRRRPLWMAPAWLIGRFRPRLHAATLGDARALERFPTFVVESVPLLLVLLLAGGFSLIHGLHLFRTSSLDYGWIRLSMVYTYLEIPIFLLLAILIGNASSALGVLFVLLFGVMDLSVAATQYHQLTPLPGAVAGRLVTLWWLWLLAVEIPVFGRSLAVSWPAMARNRLAVAALAALTTGGFTWLWAEAAPIIVRPMFIWSDLGHVVVDAVRWEQNGGGVFAVVAGVAAGTFAYLRGRGGIVDGEPAGESSRPPNPVLRIVRGLVVAALLTITLGGLIASPFEGAVLFAALASCGPLARFVADRTIVGTLVRVTPMVLRYAIATGLAFAVSMAVIVPLYHGNVMATQNNTVAQPEFYSIVFALVISFFVVALATTPGSNVEGRSSTLASAATTLLVMGGALVALILATPVTALADNCSGVSDCWGVPWGAALAAAAVPPLLAAAAAQPTPQMEQSNRDKVRGLKRDKKFWQKNPFNDPQWSIDMRQRYLDKQIEYFSGNPGLPTGDGKPIDRAAFASTGAATRG